MRHLINKHYDTPGGLLGHPTNVSSHPKPPVSKEDETMKQAQKDLLIELVKLERNRLTLALTDWNITVYEMRELNQERDLATSTLKALHEVGVSWECDYTGFDSFLKKNLID